jgi:hypothetical protein
MRVDKWGSNGQSVCELLARAPDPVRLGTEGRINGFVSADEDVTAPGATVPSFPLSAFSFSSLWLTASRSALNLPNFNFQLSAFLLW